MELKSKFKNKALRVAIVEPAASVRQLLGEVLRDLGFNHVETLASINDLHNLLETELVDWILVPLLASEQSNGLHTVRLVTSHAELRGIKVSLLLDESDDWVLPKAFELGLLSFHRKLAHRDGLMAEFGAFIQILETQDWNLTKTSASYLRNHLKQTRQFADLLALEKQLVDLFPGDGENLIHLALAYAQAGFAVKAGEILRQAELVCPEKADQIAAVRSAVNEAPNAAPLPTADAAASSPQNILGLKDVVVIDHDDAIRSSVISILTELGCAAVHDFADGDSAFEWIDKNPEPSLIIMEWRIPRLTGPILLQRIRSKGFTRSPVIILSSLIKQNDLPLIRELSVSNLEEKPVEKISLLKKIVWTIQQDRTPSDLQVMENKIRVLLSNKELSDANELMNKYLENPMASNGRKAILKAEFSYAQEQYSDARNLAIEAVKYSGESLFALNILGKCLMTLREYESALKCFRKAQSISPMNLERLITMAEVQAELGKSVDAQESLNKAKDIDPESRTIAEGAVKVAIATGSNSQAQTALASLDSNINLIRYLNNKAVAHAKCGFADEGLEIYEKTLAAIPRGESEITAAVQYNMALAKIRRGDLPSAVKDLDTLLARGQSRMHKKASSLRGRLNMAINSGKGFSLTESDATADQSLKNQTTAKSEGEANAASNLISNMLDLAPGDHCCYLVFKSTAPETANLTKVMSIIPKFRRRKSLQREESFVGTTGIKTAG